MFSKFAYHSLGDLPDRLMAPTFFTWKNHSSNMGDQKSPQIIAKISYHNDSYPKRSFLCTAWMFLLEDYSTPNSGLKTPNYSIEVSMNEHQSYRGRILLHPQ